MGYRTVELYEALIRSSDSNKDGRGIGTKMKSCPIGGDGDSRSSTFQRFVPRRYSNNCGARARREAASAESSLAFKGNSSPFCDSRLPAIRVA